MYPSVRLIDGLQADLGRDLLAFLPEIVLASAIVLMLVWRVIGVGSRRHLGYLALLASLIALAVAIGQWQDYSSSIGAGHPLELFTGLLAYDRLAIFVRIFLLAFLTLALVLSLMTGIPDRDDAADFSTLLIGSTLGMMLMAAANHLLMAFIAVEMASVPSYVLAGFMKGRRQGSEGALKYVVFGAAASGIMIYGISLLAGRFGTGYLPDLATGYQASLLSNGFDSILIAGTLFFVVGLGFKIAAVPFHFWCPDVFEGAAAEVAAFLSVASKGAALALAARFLIALAGPVESQTHTLLSGSLGLLLAVVAAATATFGNLAALAQTNLKRLLAYSTIAHAGYMLMALVTLAPAGAAVVLFYLMAYLLMNLGAFACVAFVRNQIGSEDLSSMSGLVQRAPLLTVTLAIFLLSLLGLPPLAGFAAKFQLFALLYETGRHHDGVFPALAYSFYFLLIVAALNTVISAGYYLKVLRIMILDASPADAPTLRTGAGPAFFVTLLATLVLLVGILWNPLLHVARQAVGGL